MIGSFVVVLPNGKFYEGTQSFESKVSILYRNEISNNTCFTQEVAEAEQQFLKEEHGIKTTVCQVTLQAVTYTE